MNITYYLGAGASYNACPVWKEQGEYMVHIARLLFGNENFENKTPANEQQRNLWLFYRMGYFGKKAKEFNTIDAFARKLYLNGFFDELNDLKATISLFFTVWQLVDKSSFLPAGKNRFTQIDQRYINLLATCLTKGTNNGSIKLHDNIGFITWNYDLQIELAYKMFCRDDIYIRQIDDSLSFIPDMTNKEKKLSVCHLNGFHGFYEFESTKDDLYDLGKNKPLTLSEITEIFITFNRQYVSKDISFDKFIKYAWESDLEGEIDSTSRHTFVQAILKMQKADVLVIIGYSFPPFNRQFDKNLFRFFLGESKHKKIIFQDPDASASFLADAFDINIDNIRIENKRLDQFILPSIF